MSALPHVAIVHCHYESGGVTQVVQNHVASLAHNGHSGITLLSGPRCSALTPATLTRASHRTVELLEYDSMKCSSPSSNVQSEGNSLAGEIDAVLRKDGHSPENALVHWHNHSLGKVAAAPASIVRLADMGWRLLLQVHDFAEDQRPENLAYLIGRYRSADAAALDRWLYPQHHRIAYATLTRGDASALIEFGMDPARVSVVPNSVVLEGVAESRDAAMARLHRCFGIPNSSRWVLYPVRGIRRKNVGEFLLLCQLMQAVNPIDDCPIVGGLTLRPDTPLERASYERWRSVAEQHVQNVVFDAAHHPEVSFRTNLSASELVVSTSVAEGFGMAFLEPWLAHRRVVARDLPGVTADFVGQGVRLDHLYCEVRIPGSKSWIDQAEAAWEDAYRESWSGIPEAFRPSGRARGASVSAESIDFARLLPTTQADVIGRVDTDSGFRRDLIAANIELLDWLVDADDSQPETNASRIRDNYGSTQQRQSLLAAYRTVITSPTASASPSSPSERMVDCITKSHPFFPCRTETDLPAD